MDIKDCTETEGGHEVRIYATDGAGPYPVHGAFKYSGGWVFMTWAKEGKERKDIESPLDLKLTDWRDEIRWDCLVDEIKWVARDEDGEWIGRGKEPRRMSDLWGGSSSRAYSLNAIKMPAGPTDWRKAIAQRPEKGVKNE